MQFRLFSLQNFNPQKILPGQFIYKFEPKLERQQLKYLINQFTVYRPSWRYQQTIFADFPHPDGSPC